MILKSLRSFKFAFAGIVWMVKSENNAKIHGLATMIVLSVSIYFKIQASEWRWVLLCISLVWMMELVNTAIEKTIDLVSPNHHPVAGMVKDLGAAAVLIAATFSVIVGCIIFIPYVLS